MKMNLFALVLGFSLSAGVAFAVIPCQNLTICQDQIAAIQANQTLYDAQAAQNVANWQAAIAAMPSPSPSATN